MTQDLFLRAAQCYVRAGWVDDAGRCFEEAGRPLEAARLYEQRQQWGLAAQAYAEAAEWEAAGRCYLRSGEPEPAADCLLKAGRQLEAAWVLAQDLDQFRRAQDLADAVDVTGLDDVGASGDALLHELVLARCEAGLRKSKEAARRLRRLLDALPGLLPGVGQRIEGRALAVAESLGRPDLQALIHAAAGRAGLPGAFERWQAWAIDTLGDASGLPIDDPALAKPATANTMPGPSSPDESTDAQENPSDE